MIDNYTNTLWIQIANGASLGRNSMLFFGVLFFMIFSSLEVMGQNPETIVPSYTWQSKVDISSVNTTDLNTDDLIISVATDALGNVYTLSFGKGVIKRDANGNNPIQFIAASKLDNPLDIAIDKEGIIYIADYIASGETFADNGKIKVFDQSGNEQLSKRILTSFFRPLGVDVDEDNVYIAEYNDGNQGPEKKQLSRIEIVNKIDPSVRVSIDDIGGQAYPKIPFRIAVDSKKTVYVSQAGNNDPAVLLFDINLNPQGRLPNITSPGSVVIDEFDYVHVNEYAGLIDFSEFINFGDLGLNDIIRISRKIKEGIDGEKFIIKVFDPQKNYMDFIIDKIDFPVDLIINSCDKLYVNNSEIFGTNTFIFGWIPTRLEFDLEIYQRTPNMDKAEAPVILCPPDIIKDANPGDNFAIVIYNPATATDNCSAIVTRTQGLASGNQFPIGISTVEYTATDGAGNSAICSFTVTVNAVAGTDTEDPVISCPTPITQNVDSGKCGAIVTFTNATATDNSGVAPTITRTDNTGLNSGDLFPVGSTTITFRATDGSGNFQDCSFLITITDNEKPSISCPDPISETVAFGESGKVISYAALSSADNCSGSTITQTAGIASGSEFPVGKTTNTFVVTDASNNTATCSFDVTITESSDTEKPEITCPAPITRNVDLGKCGAVVTFADATATDNSGSVTVTLISNLASGSEFPVGNSTVTFEAKDSAGNTAECSFIITVIDNEKPTISCPQNIIETAPFGETGKVITYPAPSAADNCSGSIITQTAGFASGSEFPIGKTTNTFVVTDAANNTATCSFDVTITVNTDTEKPVITCPDNINQNTDSGKCGAIVTFADATATDNSGDVTVTLISGLPSGSEFPVGNSTVTFEAKDSAGNTEKCSFIITIIDNEKPTISCPNSISETVNSGETGKVITYSFPSSGDNCSGSTITQTAGLASGSEFPLGKTTNTFQVTDASGNTANCSFDVTITENADTVKPEITCPAPIARNVDSGKCGAIITFANATATDNSGVAPTITRIDNTGLNSGDLFPVGSTTITFRATDGAGNFKDCSFLITITDNAPPTVNCPQEILVQYSTEKTYTVPDFSSLYSSSDNCSTTLNYFQTPDVGTVITEDISASFRVGDESNNFITCNFNIKFIKDTDLQITNCPTDQTFEVGNNCEFTVPDYISTITVNDPDAEITQSIPAGTEINNALPITITATLDGQTASCEFQLIPKDSIDPVVICPGDVSETYNPEDGFALPNYSLQAQTSDNCTVAKINQIPDVGTVIFENTEVTVRIEDIFGNSATCTFNVILTEENTVNTPPVATDDIYTTMQDVNLTVPASTGVLSNDTDGEGDGLSAILISSVSSGTLSLNQDGSFIYEPNAGFFGTDSFTYVSNDGIENSEIATVRIDVVAVSGNTIICKEAITLELNENGTATLNAETLFVTRPANLQFSIDKESFTCDDLGEIRMKLSYSNDVIQGSCEVVVTVKDVTPPTVNVKDITVALNEFRSVRITPEMVDNGSSDNCENITLSLDKLNFSCKELGENIVTLTVTDSSGNSSSATARVTVTGSCDLEPLPVVEYIFIYPNPTTGPFQFATPAGVTIQRVEAFDARGRMIMFKEFSVADLQYTMDLNGVQKAVYILKLFTSDGLDIKRVIIK